MKSSKIDSYWLHTYEDEFWKDEKIARQDIRFPSHAGEELNGKVTITYINKK